MLKGKRGLLSLLVLGGSIALFIVALTSRGEEAPAAWTASNRDPAKPPPDPSREKAPAPGPVTAQKAPPTPEQVKRTEEVRRHGAESIARDIRLSLERADAGRVPALLRGLRVLGPDGLRALEAELATARDPAVRLGLQDAVEKLRKPAE